MTYKYSKQLSLRKTLGADLACNVFSFVLAFAVVVISGCERASDDERDKDHVEPRAVSLDTVHIETSIAERIGLEKTLATTALFRPSIEVYGRVVPNPNATFEIMSPSAGQISTRNGGLPLPGTKVAKGQMLAVIKVRVSPEVRADFESRIVESKSRLKNNEEIVDYLSRITQGLQNIASKEILSRTELDSASANLARAKAQVALDKAVIANWQGVIQIMSSPEPAEGNFWRLPIEAPHDGTIAEVSTAEGAFVEAGALLLRIIDQTQQVIRLDVPQVSLEFLDASAKAELLSVWCQGKSYEARFIGVGPSVDLSSQSIQFLYFVEDTSNLLRPGLHITTRIRSSETTESAVKVPSSSVLQHRGMYYVYVAVEEATYQRRRVEVLETRDGETVVKNTIVASQELSNGVKDGDTVVSTGAQLLLSREFLVAGGDSD